MNQSEPKSDLIAWLEQQWDKAVKDSETPDKELLEKYTFYDDLTTAYEFTIARVKQYGLHFPRRTGRPQLLQRHKPHLRETFRKG